MSEMLTWWLEDGRWTIGVPMGVLWIISFVGFTWSVASLAYGWWIGWWTRPSQFDREIAATQEALRDFAERITVQHSIVNPARQTLIGASDSDPATERVSIHDCTFLQPEMCPEHRLAVLSDHIERQIERVISEPLGFSLVDTGPVSPQTVLIYNGDGKPLVLYKPPVPSEPEPPDFSRPRAMRLED